MIFRLISYAIVFALGHMIGTSTALSLLTNLTAS